MPWADVLDALHHHHLDRKWLNTFLKNGVNLFNLRQGALRLFWQFVKAQQFTTKLNVVFSYEFLTKLWHICPPNKVCGQGEVPVSHLFLAVCSRSICSFIFLSSLVWTAVLSCSLNVLNTLIPWEGWSQPHASSDIYWVPSYFLSPSSEKRLQEGLYTLLEPATYHQLEHTTKQEAQLLGIEP